MVRFNILIIIILALIIVGLQNPVFAQADQKSKLIIVIDPGHGGRDSGAVGVNDIKEKDVVLKIANQIVELNNTVFNKQHEIYLTRYKDTLISLGERTKLAKTLKADVFISLHCNHSDNPNARGVEVFFSKNQGKYSRESILLAYELQNELKVNLGFESRGVKFSDFQVLRETVENFQSILLELGFLSNYNEAEYFSKSENTKAIVIAILTSVSNYLKN